MSELRTHIMREELKRLDRGKSIRNRKIRITTGGIAYAHNLGVIPHRVCVMPLSELTWWYTRTPDAQRIYLKSSADGDVLITIEGD